jgi:hypothetical protein
VSAEKLPLTVSFDPGLVVPIPTLPTPSIRILSAKALDALLVSKIKLPPLELVGHGLECIAA